MSLTTRVITWDFTDCGQDAQRGSVTIAPSEVLTDPSDAVIITTAPKSWQYGGGVGSTGIGLIDTDNTAIQQNGSWFYNVSVQWGNQPAWNVKVLLPSGSGPVDLSSLPEAVASAGMQGYLPTSGGALSGPLLLDGDPPMVVPGGADGDVLTLDADGNVTPQPASGGEGGGTVTSVAMESANGLAGTVADSTTTPQITLSTTVSGLLKGNGTAITAATAGTDYLAPSGSGAALTGITAAQAGADVSGAAATAQGNAETYAAGLVTAETSRAEAAEALLAPKASPALTGTPTAPTASALTGNTQVATTAYTDAAVAAETSRAEAAETLKAPLASPGLTGSPTAPTQTTGDSSTKLATTAFVATAFTGALPALTQAAVSASGTLALNTITTATAATALTMTLPASVTGDLIVCERESASAASVSVTGNIRGVASTTITLQLASESEMFFGYGGSWWPVAGHKTLASLQALFLQGASNLSDLGSRQAALNTLAGAVTGGQFLRGNGTNVQMSAIQAADLPTGTTSAQGALQLDGTAGDIQASPGTAAAGGKGQPADAKHVHPQPPMFAPAGLTGATAASRYVGATSGGQPVSGTFSANDWALDSATPAIWICTAGGSPGTWEPLAASPYALHAAAAQAWGLTGWAADTASWSMFGTLNVAGVAGPGRMLTCGIPVGPNWSASYIITTIGTIGSGLTSGECFAALYGPTGNLLGQTNDQSTAWETVGALAMALPGGPYTGTSPGVLTVGVWYNGTTSPQFPISNTSNTPRQIAMYITGSGVVRFGLQATTGITTTAPSTLGTLSVASNNVDPLFALSATVNSTIRTS